MPEVSVEEFIDGEEFTYDTVCAGGRDRLLQRLLSTGRARSSAKQVEWISQQIIALRDPDRRAARRRAWRWAKRCSRRWASATASRTWSGTCTADGEVVFGEIGARVGGARLTDLMNYAATSTVYRGWAEAVCHGRFSQPVERKYNAAMIFKRAQGQGRITHIEGLVPT